MSSFGALTLFRDDHCGKEFILKLKDISPATREEELRASEIIVVAEG